MRVPCQYEFMCEVDLTDGTTKLSTKTETNGVDRITVNKHIMVATICASGQRQFAELVF